MIGTLWSWWAWCATVLVVILGTPVVALVFALTAPFDPGRYAAGRAFRLVGVTAMRLNGLWRFRVRGSLADPRRPYVVVANHESYADVFLISVFPWEMKWLSKDTMFKIPFMGWMMQMAGDIRLVRGNRDSTVAAMEACKDRLGRKVSVMIFPEGTRTRSGDLQPFKDGAFRLAIENQVAVLPLAVHGAYTGLVSGDWRFGVTDAEVRVLEPIETAGLTMNDLTDLKHRAHAAIAGALEDMKAGA
jgi:1-acyl-sn-glycerol-3-phosphate acyltransferase